MRAAEPMEFLGMPAIIHSEVMRELLLHVERVAATNATVLIGGESGSGKELIARALHHHSMRCGKPWVDVSCAALPEHLVESELFGYERGAFSGAVSTKAGLFELANQGTLFLDEIGELEPKLQVKLLRVLDGAPYYRLGGMRKVTVDVRILAATNQDLERCVRSGAFRSDLYHRLSQITLTVPPLRERRADIGPLAEFFLAQQNPQMRLLPEAIEYLEAHAWPGNIRQLRNTMTKAAVLATGDTIAVKDLPADFRRAVESRCSEEARDAAEEECMAAVASVADPGASETVLDGMERRMILQVLEQTGGHQQRAAAVLGISRRTLSRKLKIYGVGLVSKQPMLSSSL